MEENIDKFAIYYNSQEIIISRFRFALYSNKFRQLPEFKNSNCLTINGNVLFSTFSNFLKGAQGEEFDVTEDNFIQLLQLSEEWETSTVEDSILKAISHFPNYEKLCQKITEDETSIDEKLEKVLSEHLSDVIFLPSFMCFPLDSIKRIIISAKGNINYHLLLDFILKLEEKRGDDALMLTNFIDLQQLTSTEARKLFGIPSIQKYINPQKFIEFSLSLTKENEDLIQKVDSMDSIIRKLIEKVDKLEALHNSMPVQTDLNESFSKEKIQSAFVDKLKEFEEKAHKDLRKTNKIVNGLTRKSITYDKSIEEIRSEIQILQSQNVQLKNEINSMRFEPHTISKTYIPFVGRSLNGIISYLSQKVNGNVHEKGIIKITSSTSDHNNCFQVANIEWKDIWFTEDQPDQWIKFDFIDKRVLISHYTIKTHKFKTCHIKSWVIEGSNDSNVWDVIDIRSINVLNGPNKYQTFPCDNVEMPYKCIRLRMTGKNSRGDNVLALSNFELFGELITPEG
ncbi:F5/8 type C domain containing protein [Histomonas meleagridis]|uniref:F5/8 type C domain containing protein n=1 Tax=Histomonas meleagridis TaxID=135588 RepID=UPI003559E77F|nr:F5/8 type C domain containing protein [Histomonas meleagridis]KAH0806791.1 F5/8 type C domain containing protein [Histomonas meleagridis]